jgi:hypothetical protein
MSKPFSPQPNRLLHDGTCDDTPLKTRGFRKSLLAIALLFLNVCLVMFDQSRRKEAQLRPRITRPISDFTCTCTSLTHDRALVVPLLAAWLSLACVSGTNAACCFAVVVTANRSRAVQARRRATRYLELQLAPGATAESQRTVPARQARPSHTWRIPRNSILARDCLGLAVSFG